MQFGILGSIEVRRDDGSPVAVGGPQVRSLLALLALEVDRIVPRERLIDGLYGEDPPGDAAHALQSQVSRLRRALRAAGGAGDLVESSPAGYRLAVDRRQVDAHRFGRLVEEGRNALCDRDPAAAATLLDEAAALWRGAALADVADAPFAAAQITRLTEARLAALEDRAAASLALGDHNAVVSTLPELVAAHPLRERARALLMRGLYGAGRQAEALELFEQGRLLLADELGADPGAELAEAHLAILRADAAPTPAVRRLPAQFTGFVGREEELAQVARLLAKSRLITLTGPGGTGKTRLALEAGARAQGEVCFVDLAPLTDGAQIVPAVATALGGRDAAAHAGSRHRDAESRVLAMLTDRPQLIILDNCEHLVLDAARLTHRLLLAAPGLRVLATSREALRITGETVFPVGQLPLASADAALADQLACAAVRLFTDRAAAARPGFSVDAGTIGVVRRICARLDGLPLALELAAARLRTLELDAIDARLDDRFRLLARGDRTAEPRHRTLQAVVEWSWELLDPAERLQARRFAVFAGGTTAATAARVCELDDADELLDSLADKSLLEARGGRYRMLETVREFALRQLADSGEHDHLLRVHAEYFARLAEHADPRLRGRDQLDWLDRLAVEHDNIQAALHWAVGADPHLAARLIAAQAWYWWLCGRTGNAVELADRLLPQLDPAASAENYGLCAAVAARGGDARTAIACATAAVAGSEIPLQRPHVVFLLAIAGGRIDAEPERQLFGPDSWSQSFLHLGEGLRLLMSGRPLEAEPEFRSALSGFRDTGDRWAIATTLDKLAAVADGRGDRIRALDLIDEAVALNTKLGTVDDTADLLIRRGDILANSEGAQRNSVAAQDAYVRAAELSRSVGATDMHANAIRGLGDLARATGDRDEARELYRAALTQCPGGLAGADTRARILIGLGWTVVTDGDPAQGLAALREAFELAFRHRLRLVAASATEGLAAVAAATGEPCRAATLLGAAETLRGPDSAGDPEVASVTARCRGELGEQEYLAAYHRGVGWTGVEVSALLGEWW
ncbi:BTAD domain-containing putative transcriptional regulator [Nocardia sp. 2YAB30]|uniref:BTAD domain-containing putative transcriptional regulator n=1 Tax=unclassified Nocardia TaxID=2637762 RepID=UPI003F964E76